MFSVEGKAEDLWKILRVSCSAVYTFGMHNGMVKYPQESPISFVCNIGKES